MGDRDVDPAEVINTAIESAVRGLYTWIPARVTKVELSKCRVSVQILVQRVSEDETGERTVESWPVVPGVPIQFMGADGFRLTVPVTVGTIGSLFFSHRSLDKWLSGDGKEVDPEFDHDHALTDAVFMPGLMPFGNPWSDVPDDGISLGKDGGLQAKITSDLITLAETAANAKFVALSDLVEQQLTDLKTAITNGVPVAQDGGENLQNTILAALSAWPGSTAASKVKAE